MRKQTWLILAILVVIAAVYLAYRRGWFAFLGLAQVEIGKGRMDGEACFGSPEKLALKESGEGDVPGVTCTDTPTIARTNQYITKSDFLAWAKRTPEFVPTGPVDEYEKCFVGTRGGLVIWAPKGACFEAGFVRDYKSKDRTDVCRSCINNEGRTGG